MFLLCTTYIVDPTSLSVMKLTEQQKQVRSYVQGLVDLLCSIINQIGYVVLVLLVDCCHLVGTPPLLYRSQSINTELNTYLYYCIPLMYLCPMYMPFEN